MQHIDIRVHVHTYQWIFLSLLVFFLLPVLYTSTSTWRVGAWALFCVSPDRSLSPGTVTITAGEPLGSTRWDLPTRKTWWLVEPWKYTVDRYPVSVKNVTTIDDLVVDTGSNPKHHILRNLVMKCYELHWITTGWGPPVISWFIYHEITPI